MTIWTDYLYELVSQGHYRNHYPPDTPCNWLSQINRVESKSDTPSLITKVIRSDFVTRRTSVTFRTTLIIKTIFRPKSHTMTGKTSGAPKPPPIGAAPVGTSILPSGTSASPPSVKLVMGAPGSLATASTPQGTPSKGNGTAKPDKHSGKLIGPKLEKSLTTGTNAKGKGKEPAKVQNNGTDKNSKPKGQEK